MTVPLDHRRQLNELGYVVLPDFMRGEQAAALKRRIEELFTQEGDRAGSEFKPEAGSRRLANLADKDAIFRQAMCDERLLEYIACVLGAEFKLSSLNARSADPQNGITQPLHADMSAVADERGYWVCNSVWMLDDFTTENGAIRVVPGTQRLRQLPQDALDDPTAPHPDEQLLTGRAGTVVIMNAHLWHGALPNRTDRPRTAMHVFFARRDKPQQQYQKKLLRPETQALLSERERELLALDDPLNDELSGEVAVRSGFLK